MGRIDDVINVAGHRLGTAEIESALVSHEAVAEAAVVGRPDDLKGRRLSLSSRSKAAARPLIRLKEELRQHVAKEIGALARPDEIRFADALPKTRSGKIMRRLLREIATSGSVAGDVTTLEDFSVLEKLRATKSSATSQALLLRSGTSESESRLCRLMCGRPAAFREHVFWLGFAHRFGAQPRNVLTLIGKAEPFRTSGG